MTQQPTPEEKQLALDIAKLFSDWTANPQTKQPGHLYRCAAESLLKQYDVTPKGDN